MQILNDLDGVTMTMEQASKVKLLRARAKLLSAFVAVLLGDSQPRSSTVLICASN